MLWIAQKSHVKAFGGASFVGLLSRHYIGQMERFECGFDIACLISLTAILYFQV